MRKQFIPFRQNAIRCGLALLIILTAAYAVEGGKPVSAQQQRTPRPGAQGTASQSTADPEHGQAVPPARGGMVAYPDRPKASPEVLARGKAVYSVSCGFCHGSDAGGGSVGPNLLRSEAVLQDKRGELIAPIVHGARADRGMPKIDMPDEQISDIADWLHSLKVSSRAVMTEKINIVVGSAGPGKSAFDRTCGSCHSVTGDLKGFAAKYSDPRAMQQAWMLPAGMARRGPPGGGPAEVQLNVPPVTATVTQANGKKITGRLDSIDDFYVAVITEDGMTHRFTRLNDVPSVVIHDPLEAHRALLRKYDDKDIHDITAYLVTLK